MSHGDTHTHDHDTHHEGPRPYFPEAQWEQFQRDDIAVGKAVIVLMSGIFSIGLVLYMIVAIVVGSTLYSSG
jgi:hypothetical protein